MSFTYFSQINNRGKIDVYLILFHKLSILEITACAGKNIHIVRCTTYVIWAVVVR